MGMKISVGVAVAVLIGAATWPVSGAYQFAARAVVCVIAVVAALQAARTERNLWAFGLAAIAVLFNPIAPIALPRAVMLVATAGCLAAFVAWLMVLDRMVPAQSVAQVLHPRDAVKRAP